MAAQELSGCDAYAGQIWPVFQVDRQVHFDLRLFALPLPSFSSSTTTSLQIFINKVTAVIQAQRKQKSPPAAEENHGTTACPSSQRGEGRVVPSKKEGGREGGREGGERIGYVSPQPSIGVT